MEPSGADSAALQGQPKSDHPSTLCEHPGAAEGQVKPFFRWAGGKQRIAKEIIKLIGPIPATSRYIEPFAGGAAVFFSLEREGPALLNDVSMEVASVFSGVEKSPLEVKDILERFAERQKLFGHTEAYEEMREWLPKCRGEDPAFAGVFLALNQTCFNGLWRVNQSRGEFNVPMGYRVQKRNGKPEKLPYDINPLDLSAYSRLLQFAKITCGSYLSIEVQRGDVVYCDPPYFKQFNGYSRDLFSTKEHHEELRDWCRAAAAKGTRVILSGADNEGTRAIYGKPTLELNRACTIGCKDRKRVGELLYVWE